MAGSLDLTDPTATLLAVLEAFEGAGIEAAVYGGLALAAYGEPRETKDADLAVAGVAAERAAGALRKAGLDASVSFDRTPFGGHLVSRVRLLAGGEATGLNTADLVEPRSSRYSRLALERAPHGPLRGRRVQVLSPEDFVVFKVLSTRELDLEDARSVLRALAGRLDRATVEREVATLAVEIPDHDVAERLARVLED